MKISTKEMTLVALFTGLTAIGAFVNIPLGEVPITLQTLFVILSGLILGPKLGAFSQIVYITLGLIGVPILAGLTGGPQTILKPSFGFLIGFIFASYIVGKICNIEKGIDNKRIWLAVFIGTIVIYLFGLPYMYLILNKLMGKNLPLSIIIKTGCILFLPGDILKALISSIVAIKTLPILDKSKVYRNIE
ncbi:biotin transporter BioY [Tissierella sp. MSJ-40]|uniref:Biotin transporter n=1 Tax=Tissierella simiarum TaxID=2841534 RepID=A0ABS6EAH5_9FIRM|nr:biotin transporter BioY [Tissierella simiarum]MBU5439933.1 biotin transporter BioY [Tissierella simiarum]